MSFASPVIRVLPAFLLAGALSLPANPPVVGFTGRRAERIEKQRVEKQIWTRPGASNFQGKTFPIQDWSKYYSPLGSKRAPITVNQKRKKERFQTNVIKHEEVTFELSRWNDRLASLHKRAGIQMDDRARIASDSRLYSMMLQDARRYEELAEELSLRDLNRFQFRRNRPEGKVPVQKAGAGE